MEPQMNTDEHRYGGLTERIIGCGYAVSNGLGCGFLEKVYENALVHELRKAGLSVAQQVRFLVMYDGVEVGEYIADIVVEGTVLIELKAVKALDDVHSAQCINLLRVTRLPVCLLLNYAKPKLEIKRFVGENAT
jgi:GxxExxY protein